MVIGVTRVAWLGPVVASAICGSLAAPPDGGRLVQAPVSPTRYCTAIGWTALSVEPSRSRALKETTRFSRPVALRYMTRWGASAVPEPFSAMVGSAISNSATPPVDTVFGAEIGRASCRERVESSGGGASVTEQRETVRRR